MPSRTTRRRHDPTRAVGTLQDPAVRRPGARVEAGPQPLGDRGRGPRGARGRAPGRVRRHGRARGGRDRQPRREAHGRPLLAARPAARAPTPEIAAAIRRHAARRHSLRRGRPRRAGHAAAAPSGSGTCWSIGIGGSALGPQFVADALGGAARPPAPRTSSTTPTPTASTACSAASAEGLAETLAVVISKSGGTQETRNGMLEAAAAYRARRPRLRDATRSPSPGTAAQLDRQAATGLARALPDVGLGRRPHQRVRARSACCPAALQGLDIDALLAGAAAMDEATRRRDDAANPAALLALVWHAHRGGPGARTWSSCPTRTASCSSAATCSSS